MFASQNGHTKTVKMLLEAKADVNVANKDGDTALSIARQQGNKEIVQLLKSAGAKE